MAILTKFFKQKNIFYKLRQTITWSTFKNYSKIFYKFQNSEKFKKKLTLKQAIFS